MMKTSRITLRSVNLLLVLFFGLFIQIASSQENCTNSIDDQTSVKILTVDALTLISTVTVLVASPKNYQFPNNVAGFNQKPNNSLNIAQSSIKFA